MPAINFTYAQYRAYWGILSDVTGPPIVIHHWTQLKMKVGAGTTNLFGRWIASEGIAKDIAVRQLATKTDSEQSWFDEVKYCIWLSAGIVWLALTIPVIGGGSFQIKVEKNGQ